MLTVAITGASGAVGRAILPQLVRKGITPILFGRDIDRMREAFPNHEVDDYSSLFKRLPSCDAILHLATINNDSDAQPEEFHKINVAWPLEIASRARAAGIKRFVYLSSTHAIDASNRSYYAKSKRTASAAFKNLEGIGVSEIVAAKVYDDVERPIARSVWRTLGAIKPTIASSQLAVVIFEELGRGDAAHRVRLTSKEFQRPWLYSLFRTALDFMFAIGIILFFGWLLVLIGLVIRLDSRGPALFRQERVGQNRKLFVCWKFRTMHVGTAHCATHEMSSSAVTRVGAFLRKTKLDELPQVVNLLRRELSLVGPRPCLPSQVELIKERDRRGVYDIRPGITGYAQIHDIDMSRPSTLALWDERYHALRSIAFDLKILLATFIGGGRGDRVSSAPVAPPNLAKPNS